MKKFLTSILTFCLTVVILAQVAIVAAQVGYVNTTVRFRTQPKQDASYSYSIYVGNKVNVLSESNGWYKVEFKGDTGYIKTKYVTVSNKSKSSGTQSTQSNQPSSGIGYVRVAVRLRNEPKQDAGSIMTLYPGVQVKVHSTSNGWCWVSYKTTTGYIKAQYLYISGSGSSSGPTSGIAKVNTAVRLRNEPKQDAASSMTLYPYVEVTVHSNTNGWCKVDYKGTVGYIKAQYLSGGTGCGTAPAKPPPGPPKLESGIGRVLVAVKFRKEPKQGAVSLDKLYPGFEVEVVSTTDGWCKCVYKGATGYIKAQYLDIRGIPVPPPPPVVTPVDLTFRGTGKIKVAVRFRTEPGEGAPSKYVLYQGFECLVLKKMGEWVACEYRGTLGYFKADYVELKKEAINPLTEPGVLTRTGNINAKNIYMKLGPGYGYGTVRTLTLGEDVDVYEVHGDWCRIITKKGDAGYVLSSSVT